MDAIDKIIKQMEMDVATAFKVINVEKAKIEEVGKMASKVGMYVDWESGQLKRMPQAEIIEPKEPIIHNRVQY